MGYKKQNFISRKLKYEIIKILNLSLYERIRLSNALQKAIIAIPCQHRLPNHESKRVMSFLKLIAQIINHLHKLLGSMFLVTLCFVNSF